MSYLDQLSDVQRKSVEATEGPMMIVAGAGSGKTRVLTYRIAHLINKGVDPFNILALTFTNKAAREMQERISRIVGDSDAKSLWMGTFHSVFARILRSEAHHLGYPNQFTIYDTEDSLRLITAIIKEMNLDKDIYKPKTIQGRISSLKNSLITVGAYLKHPEYLEADSSAQRPKTIEIYRTYVERCFKAGAMDFDDLLLRTNELLARFPDVLAKYQDRFRYILVDEYQDTNHSQYLIVRALADRYQNICVVGDDAQSIYSFRGANIQNILNFQSDYPDARVFKLEQNYRSTGNIVQAAGSVIKKNKQQLAKEVWTANETGEPIRVVRNLSDTEEGYYIAKTIRRLKEDEKLSNRDFAVLYRTNAQSRAIEDALRKQGLPYRIWGGVSFYQRKEIKDVLAYLRMAVNPRDEQALLRVINFPARGIGDTTLNKLTVAAAQNNISIFEVIQNLARIPGLGLNSGTVTRLSEFGVMIQAFMAKAQSQDAFTVAEFILKQSGVLRVMSAATDPEEVARYENVQELINSIKDFCERAKEVEDADTSLTAFIQDISLATDMDLAEDPSDTDRVALMTIHMAKGLEFPVVFIAGMEENLFPSMMSINSRDDVEEERRLFYVALTRAEKRAYLTYADQRYRWGKLTDGEISRFVDEIDEKYLEFENREPKEYIGKTLLDPSIFGDEPSARIVQRGGYAPKREGGMPQKTFVRRPDPKNLKPVGSFSAKASRAVPSLSEGDKVEHAHFGVGEVVRMEGTGADLKATVRFENGQEKKLLLKFAKLTKIG